MDSGRRTPEPDHGGSTPWQEGKGVLNVEQWAELRRLHFIEEVSIRALARRFGVDRQTVRPRDPQR